MTQCRGRPGSRKERERRKGTQERQEGDGDSTATLKEQITGDSNDADEAQHQSAWGNDGNDRATAPLREAVGAARGGGGNAVGGLIRGVAVITRATVAPAAMVVVADLPGGGDHGGSGPGSFLGLMESTQLTRLALDSQGVASPTNGENQGGRLDATTNGMLGGGWTDPPTNRDKNGRGTDGDRGYILVPPPQLGEMGLGPTGGGRGTHTETGGGWIGPRGAKVGAGGLWGGIRTQGPQGGKMDGEG